MCVHMYTVYTVVYMYSVYICM